MRDDSPRPHSRLDDALALLDPLSRQIMELWLQGATSGDIERQLALPSRILEVMRARSLTKVREFIAQQAPPESRERQGKTA